MICLSLTLSSFVINVVFTGYQTQYPNIPISQNIPPLQRKWLIVGSEVLAGMHDLQCLHSTLLEGVGLNSIHSISLQTQQYV
jgi:hypothetical protein